MKKLAYIVSLFPCWSETFILNEIIALQRQGIDITIFSIRTDLEKLTHAHAREFIPRTHYPSPWTMARNCLYWLLHRPQVLLSLVAMAVFARSCPPIIRLKNIWTILTACVFARLVQKENIEHIHAHFATYPALGALAISRLCKRPYSFTAHAHDIFLDTSLLREKISAAKNVIAISDYNRRYLMEHCGQEVSAKTQVIHCGLDLSVWRKRSTIDRRDGLIVAVGRLTEMKGFDVLLEACALIGNSFQFDCHIVGEGPLRPKLEELIARLNLSDTVRLCGVMDAEDVQQLVAQANLFVAPSVWSDVDGQDGIPLVLMEAMALGTPVVASDISGIPELVTDEISGLLAAPESARELADQMLRILQDPDFAAQLADKGRTVIESEFNIEKNAAMLLEVLQGDSKREEPEN